MRSIIVGLSLLCASAITVAAPVPKERAEAEKVVGTWKLVKSSKPPLAGLMVSLEMELSLSGRLILRQSVNGGPILIYEGEYKVIKNELPYAINSGGNARKETLTIKKLTDTELILVDPDGIQEDFERVKPKKEDPKPEEKK